MSVSENEISEREVPRKNQFFIGFSFEKEDNSLLVLVFSLDLLRAPW